MRQVHEEHLQWADFISTSIEAVRLRDAWLKVGVVTPKWAADALHVALASVEHCRCIVAGTSSTSSTSTKSRRITAST